MWSGVSKKLGLPADEGPLAVAQALVYEAFARPEPAERVRMARQALEISPDCADAYVILAEHAKTAQETLEFYRQGVAAGERALGPEKFREEVGRFWGVLETRPYMCAEKGWRTRSGRPAVPTRRSATYARCCGSTPATTRGSAIPWSPGS